MRVGTIRAAIAALTLTAGLALTATAIGGGSADRAINLLVELNGRNEVPGPGDPNGKGTGTVTLKKAKGKICVQLEWSKIEDPVAGHIHKGNSEVAGPVKVELFAGTRTSPLQTCVKAPKRLIGRIAKNPGRFYVNLHNAEYPDGAIRSQLLAAGS